MLRGGIFRALLIDDGALTFDLLRTVVSRLREADTHRLDYGAYTAPERLARLLLSYARRYGQSDGGRVFIALPLTQTELADAANASRESYASFHVVSTSLRHNAFHVLMHTRRLGPYVAHCSREATCGNHSCARACSGANANEVRHCELCCAKA